MNSNCSNLLDLRNFQEQFKKAFCFYQKLFRPFSVWINCSSALKNFANSQPSASNFKRFSWSLEQFFLTVGLNNFGNKIPFLNTNLTLSYNWIFAACAKSHTLQKLRAIYNRKRRTSLNRLIHGLISSSYCGIGCKLKRLRM